MLEPVMGKRLGGLLGLVGLGLALEPLGHELAYVLHLGLAPAMLAQSAGSHAYFPGVAGISTSALAFGLLLSAGAFLCVRAVFGPGAPVGRPSAGPVFLILAVTQCLAFSIQESLEAFAWQMTPDPALIALLALIGQLPIAALAALVLSSVHRYLALAPRAVRVLLSLRLHRPVEPHLILVPCSPPLRPVRAGLASHPRRGPPSSP
jgi:hypothetical protein